MDSIPLTTQLSWVWMAHTIEVDNAFEAASAGRTGRVFRISLPMWSNGLRLIGEDGISVAELRARARSRCNLGGLERWGWLTIGDASGRRRDGYGSRRGVKDETVVRLTGNGVIANQLWPEVIRSVEDGWRSRFGSSAVDALQAALPVDAPTPWSPPEVHPSDGFRTHVVDGGDADAERPLVALLGQQLTRLTLQYEQRASVSLPLAANVLRVVGIEDVRLRDLPALTGISKEGVTMAVGYLVRSGLATKTTERTVRLTATGGGALRHYERTVAQLESPALTMALSGIVEQQTALSAGLLPPAGCWRGEKPYLTQTRRLLEDPLGALPWQPMVLHRGGWPDGS